MQRTAWQPGDIVTVVDLFPGHDVHYIVVGTDTPATTDGADMIQTYARRHPDFAHRVDAPKSVQRPAGSFSPVNGA